MRTLKYYLLSLFIALYGFSTFPQTAQCEYILIFSNEFSNTQDLIVGYDPFGTDNLDPDLGEEFISQVPSGEFGVRFQLPPDTSITTIKDIRFGCGQAFSYEHLIDLSYFSGSTIIDVNWDWDGFVYGLQFINPVNGEILATYESSFDSTHFIIPSLLNKLKIAILYNGPLSWPEFQIYSPNGGELIQAGQMFTITWWNNQLNPSLDIEFSSDAGATWEFIAQAIITTENSYDWEVPLISSEHCLIRIGNYPCAYDQSLGTFVIYENNPPALQPVEIPFRVTNATADSVQLIIGMHPLATNGIDTLLGEIEIPIPDPGIFSAAMILDDSSITLKDLRPGYSSYIGYKGYKFNVQPTIDSIVYFNIFIPEGARAELMYWQKVQYGYRFIDTTFISQVVNYQFLPNSYYGGFFNSKGILLRVYFDGTIPVELISFTASVTGNDVRLNWITATEVNNAGFNVQRSVCDVQNSEWNTISFVPGYGTTTEQHYYSFTDESVPSGKYQYRLKQIDYDGTFEYSDIIEVEVGIPSQFSLEQNYPNPFNPRTTIQFTIPTSPQSPPYQGGEAKQGWFVQLKVYDVLGNEIATLVNEEKPAGTYEAEFNPESGNRNPASGIYFYQLKAGDFIQTKKMILMK